MGTCKDDPEGCRERHLCKLAKREEFDRIRELVKGAAWYCAKCGRAARDKASLCRPEPL